MSRPQSHTTFWALGLALHRHDIVQSVIQICNLDPSLRVQPLLMRGKSIIHKLKVGCMQIDQMLIRCKLLLLMNWRDYDVLSALRRTNLTCPLDLNTKC